MNVLLVGFSTTGKSSLIDQLKGKLPENVEMIDSDKFIATEFDGHVYSLFMTQHDASDPVARRTIMESIHNGENSFIKALKANPGPYIAAIAPNVHIRPEWKEYLITAKPYIIFLKADLDSVYKGLKRRENQLYKTHHSDPAFGVWNLGVTRYYDPTSKQYLELPEAEAKNKIAELIEVNEKEYAKIANTTFEAKKLLSWHEDFQARKKEEAIALIKHQLLQPGK